MMPEVRIREWTRRMQASSRVLKGKAVPLVAGTGQPYDHCVVWARIWKFHTLEVNDEGSSWGPLAFLRGNFRISSHPGISAVHRRSATGRLAACCTGSATAIPAGSNRSTLQRLHLGADYPRQLRQSRWGPHQAAVVQRRGNAHGSRTGCWPCQRLLRLPCMRGKCHVHVPGASRRACLQGVSPAHSLTGAGGWSSFSDNGRAMSLIQPQRM